MSSEGRLSLSSWTWADLWWYFSIFSVWHFWHHRGRLEGRFLQVPVKFVPHHHQRSVTTVKWARNNHTDVLETLSPALQVTDSSHLSVSTENQDIQEEGSWTWSGPQGSGPEPEGRSLLISLTSVRQPRILQQEQAEGGGRSGSDAGRVLYPSPPIFTQPEWLTVHGGRRAFKQLTHVWVLSFPPSASSTKQRR